MPLKKLKIATETGPREVEGEVIKLYVGNVQERFFITDNGAETVLSHYASGYRVGALGLIKLTHAVRWGTGGTINNREAAKVLIAQAVERNGADVVLAKMHAVPVLNPK